MKIKAALPDLFDGTTSKLEDWFRQMDTYFLLQLSVFTSEEAKILMAFQMCRGGTATEWAKYHTEQYLNSIQGRAYIPKAVVATWDELKDIMKERFGDHYEKETAQAKIVRAKQGDRKVQQYIEEFLQLLPKADLPPDQQVECLLGGINDELWEMIRHHELHELSFQRLCNILEVAERNWVTREIAAERRKRQQRGYTPNTTQTKSYFQNTRKEATPSSRPQVANTSSRPNPPPARSYHPSPQELPQGEPMDIDQMKRRQPDGAKIKCFKCRQFGHIWKNCPVKHVRELKEEQINEIPEAHFQGELREEILCPESRAPQECLEEILEEEEDYTNTPPPFSIFQ